MRRKQTIFIVAVMVMFVMAPYVRRAHIPRQRGASVSLGSRDRTLAGKARRRARKQTLVRTDR